MAEPTEDTPEPKGIPFASFLQEHPPTSLAPVVEYGSSNSHAHLVVPVAVRLDCDHCGGVRTFRGQADGYEKYVPLTRDQERLVFFSYTCGDCMRRVKVYALMLLLQGDVLLALKLGEQPPFGQPTPTRLLTLLGGDRENFLKGRRCEFQGLGVGAFAYYRQVVENQKNRIIDELLKVARKSKASTEMIQDLEAAKKQVSFKQSVEAIQHGIPEALKLQGRNPLKALHDALSEGLHAGTDEECLAIATSIRTILVAFTERVQAHLADEKELNEAFKAIEAKKASKVKVSAPSNGEGTADPQE